MTLLFGEEKKVSVGLEITSTRVPSSNGQDFMVDVCTMFTRSTDCYIVLSN